MAVFFLLLFSCSAISTRKRSHGKPITTQAVFATLPIVDSRKTPSKKYFPKQKNRKKRKPF
ncbi:hypothetical protein CMT34_02775 [Elizabethkingia anophelis]|nr:hypothetical protein [Elizabethkingia anophelis]MDV4114947.1 hypothetical protein [Elizabethkingia anophelis]